VGDMYNAEAEIERLRGEVMAEITELKAATKLALAGVSNFREYQRESRESWKKADKFFTTFEVVAKTRNDDLDEKTNTVKDDLNEHYRKSGIRRDNKNLLIAAGLLLFAALTWYHDYKTPNNMQTMVQQTVHDTLKAEMAARK